MTDEALRVMMKAEMLQQMHAARAEWDTVIVRWR